jgi:polar amino acid transport system substrate-binding protein
MNIVGPSRQSRHQVKDTDGGRGTVAKRLNVGLEMKPLSSAERIPLLKGRLDFVATSMTRTPERLKEIDFSHIYFVIPHAVTVKKASGVTSVKHLSGGPVSSASTSTAGPNLKEVVPDVKLMYVRDYSIAFQNLKENKVDAFTTDETVLRAIVRADGHPDEYLFLQDLTKSRNVCFAMKKNEKRFKEAVNAALLDVEASGEAARIWDVWFGSGSEAPMRRTFTKQSLPRNSASLCSRSQRDRNASAGPVAASQLLCPSLRFRSLA